MKLLHFVGLVSACSLACSAEPDVPLPDSGTPMMDATVDAKTDAGKDATTDASKDAIDEAIADASTDAIDGSVVDGSVDSGIDGGGGNDAGTLANNLVGLWNLDETMAGTAPGNTDFKDESGSGGHATAKGTITFGAAGLLNKATTLDGTSAYALIPDSNALRPANFTVAVWFKLTKLPGNTGVTIASKAQKPAPWSPPFLSWMIRINSATLIEAAVGSAAVYCGAYNTNKQLQAGTWYHVMLTFDGSKGAAYLDGVSIGSCNLNAAVGYAAQPVVIGGDFGASPVADYFPGTIDQLAIWSRVLTSNEMTALYNTGAGQALP